MNDITAKDVIIYIVNTICALTVLVLYIGWCISNTEQEKQAAYAQQIENYNDGTCPYCEGHYVAIAAKNHNIIFKCDTCGIMIKVCEDAYPDEI